MKQQKLREEIDELESSLESSRHRLLRNLGWKYTCNTPGAVWLWEKQLPDGRTLLVNESTALFIEEQTA